MSVCIFLLVTSTVGTTQSLIMVGLREMREPQRKKRFSNWPLFLLLLLPWFLRKPQGSFSCFSTNRTGMVLKKSLGEVGRKLVQSVLPVDLLMQPLLSTLVTLKLFWCVQLLVPRETEKTHFTMWCWGRPWAPAPSSHSWALLNPTYINTFQRVP